MSFHLNLEDTYEGEEGDVLGRLCKQVVRKQSVKALSPQCESMSRMMDLRVFWELIMMVGDEKRADKEDPRGGKEAYKKGPWSEEELTV